MTSRRRQRRLAAAVQPWREPLPLTVPAQVGAIKLPGQGKLAAVKERQREQKQGEWRRGQVPHAAQRKVDNSIPRSTPRGDLEPRVLPELLGPWPDAACASEFFSLLQSVDIPTP